MNLFDKTEQFVVDAFTKAGNPGEISHHQRTAYWIKELKPDADEALLIAGMAHDIERAFHGDWKAGSDDPEKLKKHQKLSASIVEKFLREQGAPDVLIMRVTELILHHEEGGNEAQNVLCDADCLAYFEEKALRNAKKYKAQGRAEEMKKKLEYVFGRISAPKAKAIAQKWFQEALSECDRK
jgi:hypothetical protein